MHLERLERVRGQLREAAKAIRDEGDADDEAAKKAKFSSGYTFMQAFDFLDDACVTRYGDYRAFLERQQRIHKDAVLTLRLSVRLQPICTDSQTV